MRTSPAIATACAIGIVLALLGFIYGAWAPYRKAQEFINAEHRSGSVRTLEEFKSNFDQAFDYPSPIGTEEITKFLSGNLLNIVPQQSEDIGRELVAYIEPKLFKDEVRHLMMAAQFRQGLWQQYGQEADYLAAVDYYQKAHEIGTNLPTPLYSLFGMYQLHKDDANMRRVGQMILDRWPTDAKISAALNASSTPAAPGSGG